MGRRISLLLLGAGFALLAPKGEAYPCHGDLPCALLCLDDPATNSAEPGAFSPPAMPTPTAQQKTTWTTDLVKLAITPLLDPAATKTKYSIKTDWANKILDDTRHGSMNILSLEPTNGNAGTCTVSMFSGGECVPNDPKIEGLERTLLNFNYILEHFDFYATAKLLDVPCQFRNSVYAHFVVNGLKPNLVALAKKFSKIDLGTTVSENKFKSAVYNAADLFINAWVNTTSEFSIASAICGLDRVVRDQSSLLLGNNIPVSSSLLGYSYYAQPCKCPFPNNSPPEWNNACKSPAPMTFTGLITPNPATGTASLPVVSSPWHGWLYSTLAAFEHQFYIPVFYSYAYSYFGGGDVFRKVTEADYKSKCAVPTTGTLAKDATCTYGWECASGVCSASTKKCVLCTAATQAADCPNTGVCDATTGSCTLPKVCLLAGIKPGDTATPSDSTSCAVANSTINGSGKCVSPAGGYCASTPATECAVPSSTCTGNKCLSPPTGACSVPADCNVANSACTGNTCLSPPGGYCASAGTECAVANSACTGNACLSPPGGACSSATDCKETGSTCPSSKCLSAVGKPCGTIADCQAGASSCTGNVCT